jgi:hypothetical protein
VRNLLDDLLADEANVITHGDHREGCHRRLAEMEAACDRMERS